MMSSSVGQVGVDGGYSALGSERQDVLPRGDAGMDSSFPISLVEIQSRSPLARDYPGSFVALHDAALWLEADGNEKRLAILAQREAPLLAHFAGVQQPCIDSLVVNLCPLTDANTSILRDVLPWLRPVPLGLATSAGCGDRLG